jgi:hypothetical protein
MIGAPDLNRSVSNVNSVLSASHDTLKNHLEVGEQKLGFTTALLLRLRQKSINQMISGINLEYDFKYRNTHVIEDVDNSKNKIANKRFLFHSGDGFRIKWDLIIMFLAIYNCYMVPVQF